MITAAVVGLSLIPYDTVFVPEWHLRIVDGSGNPVVGVRVVQFCTNYTLGIHPCELVDDDEMTTDNDGFVVFPARKIRANLLYRVTRPIFGLVLLIVFTDVRWSVDYERRTNYFSRHLSEFRISPSLS